ncbi:MAG: hypothetical protein RMI91_01570 [Gemmatales bacterium]|nr:hypothetical protein [Gemmatales bacterium]MDW7993315.1 hypothetical protein [Gemmatales bacterium]
MRFRDEQILQLRELLKQLLASQERLWRCQDDATIDYLAECMWRDLERCRRIVQSMKTPSRITLPSRC